MYVTHTQQSTKEHEELFGSDGYLKYLHPSDVIVGICICVDWTKCKHIICAIFVYKLYLDKALKCLEVKSQDSISQNTFCVESKQVLAWFTSLSLFLRYFDMRYSYLMPENNQIDLENYIIYLVWLCLWPGVVFLY